MILVTGDIHGKPDRLSSSNFPFGKELTRDDYVIICGDFGLIWNHDGESKEEKYWLDWLENKPWTTLFVDGNHENFNRLDELPTEEWNGGRVSYVRPHIIHLKRGYVFNIDGKKIFAMGGASSHDIRDGILDIEKDYDKIKEWSKDYFKLFRINNYSWWKQELPNQEELDRGIKSLEENNWEVDYIISHCASASTESLMRTYGILPIGIDKQPDCLNQFFDMIEEKLSFRKHYFGHYHCDIGIPGGGGKQVLLYNDIEEII